MAGKFVIPQQSGEDSRRSGRSRTAATRKLESAGIALTRSENLEIADLPKGERTRAKIMQVAKELFEARPLEDVRVVEITRAAGLTQPNFYVYFDTIEDVIIALAEEIKTAPDALCELVEQDWTDGKGLERARELVRRTMQYYDEHGPVILMITRLADRGRAPFSKIRVRLTRRLFKAFEEQVRRAQNSGRISKRIHPRLAGYECTGYLLAIAGRHELHTASGFTQDQFVDTTACMLFSMTTGYPNRRQ